MPRWLAVAGQRLSGSALGDTFTVAYQTRVTGLAAEASFWAIFALPWLLLGLTAGLGKVQQLLGVDALGWFTENTLELAQRGLTPEAMETLLVPLLDSVVSGSGTISFFGFAIAIYAGSRLIGTLVDGMAIVYRQEGIRSFVRARVVSLGVYAAGLAGLVLVIPSLLLGPRLIGLILPDLQSRTVSGLLIAAQLCLVLAALVSLYHVAVPHRTRWRADVPGALLAIALFSVFSLLLRIYFGWLFREGSVYGAISAPIAVMWWVYVTNLSLLLGAAFNGALAVRLGWVPTMASPAAQPADQPAAAPSQDPQALP